MLRRLTALALTLALGSAAYGVNTAAASTGGTPDGEQHPAVGLLLAYFPDGVSRCSGALITPTLVLTAAHCTDGVQGKVLLDFRSVIAERAPAGYPSAATPSQGYSSAEIEAAGFRSGTPHTQPQYSNFTDLREWNDVGVIVLDRPLTDIAPLPVAPVGTLDRLARNELGKTLFRAVGYGTEVRKPETGPQKPTPFTYPLLRRHVDMPGQKLTEQILQTNGNDKDPRGTGGTCFGDSGGPVLWQGNIVAVTSYGFTENCRYLGGYQRVDIAPSRTFLAGFGG